MGTQLYTPSSNSIIHNTKVDFTNRLIQKPINLVQYDRGMPIIAVSLYKNGLSYSLPTGMTAKIRWGKKDRTFVYKDALGCNTERNIIFFDVDGQMTYFHGKLDPIIELVDSSGSTPTIAGSSSIPVVIERNPIQESYIESTSEYIDLLQALEDARGRSAFVQYRSSTGWAKIAQIRLPNDNSQRESVTFLVTAEDNSSTTAERYTGILELNTHENASSSALKWLVVSGFGFNNFNLRKNGDRLEVWVLPTVGTLSFAMLSETMSGENVNNIELFDVDTSATRTGTSLGYSEKLTIITNAEIKAAISDSDETIYWQGTTSAPIGNIITDMLGQPQNSARTDHMSAGDGCDVYELTLAVYNDYETYQGTTLIYVPHNEDSIMQFILLLTVSDGSVKYISYEIDVTATIQGSDIFGYRVLLKPVATGQEYLYTYS